jgi:hypothetical protein
VARVSKQGWEDSGGAVKNKEKPVPMADSLSSDPRPIPPGGEKLPEDGPSFAEALHAKADLIEVGARLLQTNDPRIVRAVWEHALLMRYGKDGGGDGRPETIVVDVARPQYNPEMDLTP